MIEWILPTGKSILLTAFNDLLLIVFIYHTVNYRLWPLMKTNEETEKYMS